MQLILSIFVKKKMSVIYCLLNLKFKFKLKGAVEVISHRTQNQTSGTIRHKKLGNCFPRAKII